MKCFVTGASGFIGANLVHELVANRHRVRALLRPGSDLRGLQGVEFERVEGDLSDRARLAQAMEGCDWCFHVAASYHLWLRDYGPMYEANVQGTRNVIEAAAQAGCMRIVYTSTVGCIGLPVPFEGRVTPSDESTPVREDQMSNHYKRSKWQAEQIATTLARRGMPVIIVNPSTPVGPRDVKPTPTGQIIGQRYILGHAEGNWTMKQALDVLAKVSGVAAPEWRIPYKFALIAAHMDEALSRLTRRPPRAPLAGVRMAKHKMYFNPAKAIRELHLPQTPPEEALADAVKWFRANGYVK